MMLLSPPSSPPPSRHPSPVNANEDHRAYTRRRSEPQVGMGQPGQSMIEQVGDRAPPGGGKQQRKQNNSGSLRGKITTRTRQSIDRNGARSPNPNLIQRSASASSRRPPNRITSPPPPSSSSSTSHYAPRPTSPTPSSQSTPRQTNFAFPPSSHQTQPPPPHQSPLSPVPRRASHLTRPVAGFMTPGASPNHGSAVLPEHGPYGGQDEGGRSSAPPLSAPPMRTSFSAEQSTSRGALGTQPSSPSSNPDRRPHPSKRSHTTSTAPVRSISYTLPQEPRSSHCAGTGGDSSRPCTAESYLRDVLGKAGGLSSGGGKMALDLEEVDLEEEMRKAEETMAEEMIRWADGVGDCPRALVLQEAINASRPPSAMSNHSATRRSSLTSQPHPRHQLHLHQRDVGHAAHLHAAGPNRRYQDQNQQHSPSTPSSPRAVFTTLERRPIIENAQTKKRTHSTSSSPSVRSSNLTPLSSSPSSVNQQQLPSPRPQLTSHNSSTSNSSSGPSSTSSISNGPLPTYHPHFRSPSSRPQRSITCPVQIPASPPLTAHSPTFEPSSLTSIMSSSSIHPPQRSSSRNRPSFGTGNAGSPSQRTVSQPLVPTRARLGSECKDFDLEASYQRCKDTGGYVSFADVGVGCPFGSDDEEEEEETAEERGRKGKGGSWWGWLAGGGAATSEPTNKD